MVRRFGPFGAEANGVYDLGDEDREGDGLEDVEGQPTERALDAIGCASGALEILPCRLVGVASKVKSGSRCRTDAVGCL